jgi:ssDNA-binding Zn-finger/Zn-ribbon topoisomerase 1
LSAKRRSPAGAEDHGCEVAPTGVDCPECGAGTLEPQRGRFGPVYKCTGKPACKFWLDARPLGRECVHPRKGGRPCGAMMVEGTKTIPDRCSDRSCPNRNPHKLAQAV